MTVFTPERSRAAQPRHDRPPTGDRLSQHLGLILHVISLAAGGAYLLVQDDRFWFFADEWDFIVDRGFHHPALSIWAPHNEHWVTLPIVLWRLLYTLFGIHHYWPYVVPLVAVHLLTCHFIYRLARDDVTSSTVAALGVVPFVFFGPGAENLGTAFQITFVGPLALGLGALLLVRHPHIGAWRMAAASALTLGSLMCSAVGVAMLVAVAVAALLRCGVRVMAAIVAVPLVAYLLWYERYGHSGIKADHITPSAILGVPAFVLTSISDSLGQAVGLEGAGAAIAVGLAAFICVTWSSLLRQPERVGMLSAVVVFLVITALARAQGGDAPASRYVYVIICLLLPVLLAAVGRATAFRAGPPLLVIAALVLVSDISALQTYLTGYRPLVNTEKSQVLTEAALVKGGATLSSYSPYAPNLQTQFVYLLHQGELRPPALTSQQMLAAAATYEVAFAAPTSDPHLGGLRYVAAAHVSVHVKVDGCIVFRPKSRAPQVALDGVAATGAVSVESAPGATFVLFVGSPPGPGVSHSLSASGQALLSESLGGQRLEMTLPAGRPTTICGLSDPPRRIDRTSSTH